MFPSGEIVEPHLPFANNLWGYEQAKAWLLEAQESYGFDGVDISGEATNYYWFPFFPQLANDPELSEQAVRTLLGAYLFTGEEVFKTLGSLSGGEQSRVRLARLILGRPEVLVLDEPTNHLDIPSREMLEEALLAFGGAIIVVSHDRYFLDRIIDRLLVIRRDEHAMYPGNYSAYLEQAERQREAPKASKTRRRKTGRSTAGRRKPNQPRDPHADLSLEELERKVIACEATLEQLNARFGDPEVCKDPAALATLRDEIETRIEELAAMNRAWEQRVDAE